MKYFINHKLIKGQDGYIVELYLDQNLSEFAKEFHGLQRKGKETKGKENLQRSIEIYIKERLPKLKVKTVNIMLGSLQYQDIAHTIAKNQYLRQMLTNTEWKRLINLVPNLEKVNIKRD
ncbi:hypothetical protein [Anaeromicrobium sediminis]|uniref:hypothetical protein n=1 Tax=Anaeromicrobium sediminis TaxID=1478221 RepID=UPI001FA91DAF|nr:hypothetical protein [Anaeromicrobium sediminis]